MKKYSNSLGGANFSRRQFLGSSAALGLAVAVGPGLWTPRASAQTVKGGHMKLGIAGGSTTDSLDPSTYTDTFMVMVGYTMRGNLIEVMADGSAGAELAESFEGSDAAKKWQFKLRKGLTFSNGKTLTIEDVIGSINYHRGADTKSGAKSLLEAVTDIKADGSDSVVFTLSAGNADFPFVLADYHLNIMPIVDGKPDFKVGAGPYKLKDFDPGVRATFERNEKSHKSGNVDSAEMLGISDSTARQSGLRGGEVDIINRADVKTVDELAKTEQLTIVEVPGRLYYTFAMVNTVAPFDNPDVRMALKYSIDRDAVLNTILNGHGVIGNDQPITPDYRYYATDLPARNFDPDKAKFHLKKAGAPQIEVNLSAADAAFPGAVDAALLYADTAGKAGMKINVVRESNDGYWDNVWLKKDFFAAYWGGRPTEDVILTIAFSKGIPWNESKWDNAKFNELLVAARAELDESRRRGMYEEMQHIVSDDGGVVIPVFANNVAVTSNKVGHPEKISGVWELDGGRCIERWWKS